MRTSFSRFANLRCFSFLALALFAISASFAASSAAARAQSQSNQSQDQKQNSQSQSSNSDQTPSAQTGSSVPDKTPPPPPPPDAKSKKDKKNEDPPESKLHITVLAAETNKPIGAASVYIRYSEGKTLLTHKEKEAEENYKTNQDGTVKVPGVPQGKVLIQVIAPGWHTYGKWYDINKDEMDIEIKLDKPPRWY